MADKALLIAIIAVAALNSGCKSEQEEAAELVTKMLHKNTAVEQDIRRLEELGPIAVGPLDEGIRNICASRAVDINDYTSVGLAWAILNRIAVKHPQGRQALDKLDSDGIIAEYTKLFNKRLHANRTPPPSY